MLKYGFFGAGNMAQAIVKGMVRAGQAKPGEIGCCSATGTRARELSNATGIQFFPQSSSLSEQADVWILACKPAQLTALALELAPAPAGKLVFSMLAGTTLNRLRNTFPKARNWVRSMPNTPAQIAKGITGYTPNSPLCADDSLLLSRILDAMGESLEVPEQAMDTVTAVSGSGVAYVFNWAAAMIESAVAEGLTEDVARKLVLSTFSGAAALMEAESTTRSPEDLRAAVVSKGGTTEAALRVFASNEQTRIIREALSAARKRSEELANLL